MDDSLQPQKNPMGLTSMLAVGAGLWLLMRPKKRFYTKKVRQEDVLIGVLLMGLPVAEWVNVKKSVQP
jgi:hypothetical protein